MEENSTKNELNNLLFKCVDLFFKIKTDEWISSMMKLYALCTLDDLPMFLAALERLLARAAGKSYEDLVKYLGDPKFRNICGLNWKSFDYGYRCKTCGESDLSAVCLNCFNNANHEGHDCIFLRFYFFIHFFFLF